MTSSNRRMLVVGNGFDLAHGLPTRYQDMLDKLFSDDTPWLSIKECQLYRGNPLIRYFHQHQDIAGWTGFEGELQIIINYFCQSHSAVITNPDLKRSSIEQAFGVFFCKYWREKRYRELWQSLQQYLNELISYIDLYLSKYIPSQVPKTLSTDS